MVAEGQGEIVNITISRSPGYASITAPGIIRCAVYLNDNLIDVVWAGNGGSHTWWQDDLLRGAKVQPGDQLRIVTNGQAAFRMEF